MLNFKSISETLAVLGSVALIAGCGSSQAPVNSTESPKEETKEAATTESGDAAAGAAEATPASAPAETAAADASPSASAATTAAASASAAPAAGPKKTGSGKKTGKNGKKKDGAQAGCGEGSCG